MAIEKTIEINVDSKQAEKNLKSINVTIDEQKEILVLLEEEYAKAKQALDKYNDSSRVNLAQEKQLKKQLTERKNALTDQRLGLKKLSVEQRAANNVVNDFKLAQKDNTNIIRGIDKLTGGYATKVVKLKKGFLSALKGVKSFTLGLKGLKGALIATGIGALAVGIGFVVANLDKVKEMFGFISEESKAAREALEAEAEALNQSIAKQTTELQTVSRAYESGALKGKDLENVVKGLNEKYKDANLELDENNNLTSDSLAFIDSQIKAIKVQAKNKAILTNIEALYSDELQAQTLIGQQNNKFMVERAKLEELLAKQLANDPQDSTKANALRKQIARSQEKQKDIANEIKSLTNQRANIQSAIDKETKRLDFSEFTKPKKRSKESSKGSGKSAEDIEKEKAKKLEDLKNKIRDAEANKEDEARALQLTKIREHNEKLLQEAKDADLLTQELKDSLGEKVIAKQAEFDAIDAKRRKKKEAEDAASRLKQQEEKISELELQKNFDELSFQEQKKILNEREQLLLLDKLFFKTLSNDQIKALEKQFSEAESERIKLQEEFKEDEYKKGYDNLQNIISLGGKKMEKVGKALAIADVVRTASKSVSETVSSTGIANAKATAASPLTAGMPFVAINTAKAALSIGSTVASAAKSISSIKGNAKSVSGSAPADSGGGGGGSVSTPPAFNIVGASDTNQLADAIGGQSQQPIQTYVVANDVTTAQSLQNNIVEGATIG